MKILIIILLIIYIILFILNLKLKNPYKLYLILGNKGTGKTAYMTKLAYKYYKKGYSVFTNFGIFNNIDNYYYLREYPKDSVIFIDETGLIHDNRQFKSFPQEAVEFFKYQRKRKLIVYLSSQSADVDKKIRDVVDYTILLRRFMPIIFPVYYHNIMKLEKQVNTGGMDIVDTLTTTLIPIKFSDVFLLNSVVKKYDTNLEVKRKK